MKGFGKIKYFKQSGARLYIPQKIINDSSFPFKDNEIVKIEIGNSSLKLKTVEWWEMLDWKTMPEAFEKLPEETKEKIRSACLI
jgi:predicted DNA-binding protein (MmcQ/YjbR family)